MMVMLLVLRLFILFWGLLMLRKCPCAILKMKKKNKKSRARFKLQCLNLSLDFLTGFAVFAVDNTMSILLYFCYIYSILTQRCIKNGLDSLYTRNTLKESVKNIITKILLRNKKINSLKQKL